MNDLFKNVIEPFKADTYFITKTYLDAGYECFVVGGPIRDLLLGLKPKDIDFATNCPLEITKKLFKNVLSTGEDHGTLTIHLNGENYEITRYRNDVSCDGRNATIEFSETFEDDAIRRDFTINAIGFNPITKEIKDPTGGLKDFEDRILRFVGKSEDRIKEDMLRCLRYTRFLAKLEPFGFKPEIDQFEIAIKTYDNSVVSVERIYQEFDGMFEILKKNDYSKDIIITMLDNMKVFERFISDNNEHYEVLKNIFETYDYFPLVLSLKGDNQKLKLSFEYKKLYHLFESFKESDFSNQVTVKDLLTETKGDFTMAERVMSYFKTYNKENNHKEGLITLKALKNKVGTVDAEPFMITHLQVDGQDMISKGLKGIEIGTALDRMLEIVKADPSKNNKEYLLKTII